MRKEKSAGIVLYYWDSEPKFLLLKYQTYWGFSKGMVEKDETQEKAAIRELKEEAGISCELIEGFKFEQNWFFKLNNEIIKKHAIFFLGKTTKQLAEKVVISKEHEDFAWLSFDEAIKKMKIKNNKEMLTKAREFILEYEKQKKLRL